jgi:hypothetical protein
MAYQLVQPLYVNGTKDGFTLPRTNPLKARMSDASNAGGILQADIAYADNQQKAFDRFLANSQNTGGYLLIPQATAGISANTVADIRSGLALETSVQSRATQTSVNAIPTNPLLTTDTRLNNLDAAISTRLATTAYTAPTTPPTVVQIRQEIDTNSTKLDVAVGTRLAASSYVAPTTAPTAAQNASAVRTELATELARVDATISSRLASASYTAPANADIAAIKAKTDLLAFNAQGHVASNIHQLQAGALTDISNAVQTNIERVGGMLDVVPTLAEIEASAVLAKQSGFTGLATATNVTNAQTAIVAEVNANETKIDAIKVDTAAIKTKTDALVNAPSLAQIEASTVLAKEATVASKASQASVTALGIPLQASSYVAPANADIAAIKAKTDTLVNTDISGLPTLTEIEASSVLAKASPVSAVDTKVTAIKAKTDTLVNAPTVADIEASTVLAKETTLASKASQASVTALGSPMQASTYVVPDNATIAEIKTKVDTLQNTDLTAVNSALTDIKGTGYDAAKHNLVKIKQQASLAAALSA